MKEEIRSRVYALKSFLVRAFEVESEEEVIKRYQTSLKLEKWRLNCFKDMVRIKEAPTFYFYANNLPRLDMAKMSNHVFENYDEYIPDRDIFTVFEFASNSNWYKSSKILSIVAVVSYNSEIENKNIGSDHLFSASIYLVEEGLEVSYLKDFLRIYLKPDGSCGFITTGDKEWIKDQQTAAELLYAICGNILSSIIVSKNGNVIKHEVSKKLNKKRLKLGKERITPYYSINIDGADFADNQRAAYQFIQDGKFFKVEKIINF